MIFNEKEAFHTRVAGECGGKILHYIPAPIEQAQIQDAQSQAAAVAVDAPPTSQVTDPVEPEEPEEPEQESITLAPAGGGRS